jgi:hypothetical protein
VAKLGTSILAIMLALTATATAGDVASPPTAAALYEELRNVGLDPARVYEIRDATLDREDIHITLSSGTIAFSQSVEGRITGAFFEGDGDILLVPPNHVERSSLALYTGAAILEEQFGTAYFRFDDDTVEQLQSYLRRAKSGPEFLSRWDPVARSLANADVLNLLQSFTYVKPPGVTRARGRFFHARLGGNRLGNFDVFLNSGSEDQVVVGQVGYNDSHMYYDIWTAFPMASARKSSESHRAEAPLRIGKYKISTRVIPPRELESDAILDCMAAESGPRTLIFELSRYLQVRSVWLDGHRVEFLQNPALEGTALARRGNDVVVVVLPQPLTAGAKLQLRFMYSGSVMSEAGGGLMYVGARGTWYPSMGPAIFDFDLEFQYPDNWTLVATGKRVSQQMAGTDQVAHWVSEKPMPLAGFNLGRYVSAQAVSGSTVVKTYAARGVESSFPTPPPPPLPIPKHDAREPIQPPPAMAAVASPVPAAHARSVAQRTARALDFFAEHFGAYPYSSLALTQMPGRDSQGWPTLIFLSSYAYLGPTEQADIHLSDLERLVYRELMPAHEAAHQWWGDLVTWNNYRDLWLAEALASYSALLMLESSDPGDFRSMLDHYRDELLRPNKDGHPLLESGPVTLGPRLSNSRFPNGYEGILYGRGAWLLHMLRYIVRDPTPYGSARARSSTSDDPDANFYRALRNLRQRFGGGFMTTADFRQAFEQELPRSAEYEGRKSLAWFFDGWVNGTAIPKIEINNVRMTRRGVRQFASGTLTQRDAPSNLVTLVPIYASAEGKLVFINRVFADGDETSFRLAVPPGTRKLVVDPYRTILTREHGSRPPATVPAHSASAPSNLEPVDTPPN